MFSSIIVANGLVVVGMGEAVEVGFMGCKYAGLTANSVGLMVLGTLLIFDRFSIEFCVYLAWLVPKKGKEWIDSVSSVKDSKGTPHEAAKILYQHGVARPLFNTAMGIIPTLVCLAR